MTFIHLADLHLGKTVLEAPMLEDQQYFLNEVLQTAVRERADAIVVAGDLYDRSVPPAEAVEALDIFLEGAHRIGTPVMIVSGNHDSPERLQFLSGILAQQNLHIAGLYDGRPACVTLKDKWGPVHFHLLPFLKPAFVRHALGREVADTDQAVRAALENLPARPEERNVLVAHQFVCTDSSLPETCDSEILSVGGTDRVEASVFDSFDYVALGHLHKPQPMGRDTLRYAGSPLKYSLSEVDHRKSFPLVTLSEKGRVDVQLIPVKPRRDFRRIRGELFQLLEAARETADGREDYIWAVLTGEPGLDPAERLRLLYPHLLHVETETAKGAEEEGRLDESGTPLAPQLFPAELFDAFFQTVNGREPTASQRERVARTLAHLQESSAEA